MNARKRTQGLLQLQVRGNAVVENAFVSDGLWLKSLVQFDNDLAWDRSACGGILNGLLPPTRGARQTHNQRCEQREMTHIKLFGEYDWLIQRQNNVSEPNIVASFAKTKSRLRQFTFGRPQATSRGCPWHSL